MSTSPCTGVILNTFFPGKKPDGPQPGTQPTTTEDPEDMSILIPDAKETEEGTDDTEKEGGLSNS